MNEQVGLLLNRINVKVNTNEWSKDAWIRAQAALLEEWELGDFPSYELTTGDILNENKNK